MINSIKKSFRRYIQARQEIHFLKKQVKYLSQQNQYLREKMLDNNLDSVINQLQNYFKKNAR